MLPFIIIRCRSGLPSILAVLRMHPGGCTAFDFRDLVERAVEKYSCELAAPGGQLTRIITATDVNVLR